MSLLVTRGRGKAGNGAARFNKPLLFWSSPVARHSVTDKGDARKYFTVIPNVVYSLNLTPHELALYNLLKRTAGEGGTCWKSTATLAKEANMSAGSVSNAKDNLCKPRAGIGNEPLITVTEEKNEKGGKPRHIITMTDVWPYNVPSSISEVAQVQPMNVQVQGVKFTSSSGEIKNISREEDSKEENKTPSAYAELMDFHSIHIKGPIPDGAAQGGAIKWLLGAYNPAVIKLCYESQLGETWRARVSWLTVKSEIGRWLSRNGSDSKNSNGNGNSGSDYEFSPKSITR